MKTTHQIPVYPQTVEIPAPLEIHPSVDPELARGLIAAVEYIDKHPEEFDMTNANYSNGKGCVICHVERLSNWRRPKPFACLFGADSPLGDARRIYSPTSWDKFMAGGVCAYASTAGRIARISHFLSTGQ